MKRKRVDFASPSLVLEVKSKRRGTRKELIEGVVEAQVRSARYLNDRFDEQRRERERGLRAQNTERQRKGEQDRQEYRNLAAVLIAANPQLRRATRNGLAQKVRAELVKRGRVVSTRTIWEALGAKNKV